GGFFRKVASSFVGDQCFHRVANCCHGGGLWVGGVCGIVHQSRFTLGGFPAASSCRMADTRASEITIDPLGAAAAAIFHVLPMTAFRRVTRVHKQHVWLPLDEQWKHCSRMMGT